MYSKGRIDSIWSRLYISHMSELVKLGHLLKERVLIYALLSLLNAQPPSQENKIIISQAVSSYVLYCKSKSEYERDNSM